MTKPAFAEGETEIIIPFHDVDMLEIAWHGHYCRYFEIARCKLLESIQYDYTTMRETGYAWPIIELHIRYPKPARFGQAIRVTAQLVEYEYRMKIVYRATDAATGATLARGHTVQVAVSTATGEMYYGAPPVFLEKLGIDRSDSAD